jgi:hypothetical protein
MNRHAKLTRAGVPPDLAGEWALLPGPVVDTIVKAWRGGGRHALARDRARRAEARQNRHWRDADQIAAGIRRQLVGLAGQAAEGDLMAASALYQMIQVGGPIMLQVAVNGLRAQGYTEYEIAAAFGVRRQAVTRRFGAREKGGPTILPPVPRPAKQRHEKGRYSTGGRDADALLADWAAAHLVTESRQHE